MPEVLLDAAGRPRSPATVPGYHAGRSPRNKGQRYPAYPPTVSEIVAVMRHAGSEVCGGAAAGAHRRALARRLRIHEALALGEAGLDPRRGSLLVRRGKGGRRREVGMDDWAWEQLHPGSPRASGSRSVRCCASRPARPADVRGRRALPAPSCARPPCGRACAVGSRRISSVPRTRSRWPEKECR